MIRIVNWLLTRRCNLKCDYCSIVRNKEDKPVLYPEISHYHKNEMDTNMVLRGLKKLKTHNPDCFHIFYGGEPLLRNDLHEILFFCNKENIHYTVISNNTDPIIPLINKLLDLVNVRGFTASVDPVLADNPRASHQVMKSISGLHNLRSLKKKVKDLVAEVTVTKQTLPHLCELIEVLTLSKINSDITFIDIAKNPFYDFSNTTDESLLVTKNEETFNVFKKLLDSPIYDIHMKDTLLPEIYNILPSNLDCGIDENLHTIAIDSDNTLRLCLRIRGVKTPSNFTITNFMSDTGTLHRDFQRYIKKDKNDYCELCNHTCYIMGKTIEEHNTLSDDLIHKERRK